MPMAPEPARPDGGQRIAERGGDAGELGQRARCRGWTSSDGPIIVATPPKPSSTPAILRGVIRSSCGEEMGDDHAPDRRGRVEDRGEAAGDMRLAPAEQGERQRIVEQREQQDRAPHLRAAGRACSPLKREEQPHRRRGDRQPQPDIGQRRHVAHGDADEEEGAAPDQRRGCRGSASRCGSSACGSSARR